MTTIQTRVLSGFMELLPKDQIAFNQMMDTIRSIYELFGFVPVDTPAIERAEVLLAKAGGETEKQIYRFQKGDNDLALRFDLTVPLARYVSEHVHELSFPFRRYHIAKVYRGERPQKGRFREFYQCDIDIIGEGDLSLVNDAEIPSIIYCTFTALGFSNFIIRINNRKILNAFFQTKLEGQSGEEVLRVIDKIEKIGRDAVVNELLSLGLNAEGAEQVIEFVSLRGEAAAVLVKLKERAIANPQYEEGVRELELVTQYVTTFGVPSENFQIDLSIARGLDYYTGTVYETVLNDYPEIGSVCSGGRYDNLTAYYSDRKLPGVGISIGLTRLFYQLREAGIIKPNAATLARVLVLPVMDDIRPALLIAARLREAGIKTEIYLEEDKLKKKMRYASTVGVPYVVLVGEEEVSSKTYAVKNMVTGEQQKLSLESLISLLLR